MWLSCYENFTEWTTVENKQSQILNISNRTEVVIEVCSSLLPTFVITAGVGGDPRREEFYFYMKSYSPVDNVSLSEYHFLCIHVDITIQQVYLQFVEYETYTISFFVLFCFGGEGF